MTLPIEARNKVLFIIVGFADHPVSNSHTFFFTHTFSFIFLVLFTERACSQLVKANLGRPWLNKQITKIYRQKLSALPASYFYRQKLCKIIFANLKNLFSVICGFRFPCFRIPDSGFWFPIPDSGFRFRIPVSGFLVLGLPLMNDPRIQFDCKYLDFSLLYRRQLRVFLKDTVIQVISTNFHWQILSNSLIVFDVSSEMYSAYKNLIMFVCKMMKYPSLDRL